ncbi:MAG TPA: kinase/pyrophosphorylase [Chromatiaceae bacterium]|nr:kinase/pyrophosphorylase [Chromatiaceae bacterium]
MEDAGRAALKRTIFFLSDHTGLTAEAIGRSLLSQFQGIDYDVVHRSFLHSMEKIEKVVQEIDHIASESGSRPIIFSTLVDPAFRKRLKACNGLVIDYFETFTGVLEDELQTASCHKYGQVHSMTNANAYHDRIDAVNFALTNDDGTIVRNYPAADLILLGVSRSGKTPTCLYMALQYSILAANYPLTEDDLESRSLPESLQPFQEKLYGLTIDAYQLQRIRQERRATGRYATLEQCQWEISAAEKLYKRHRIPYIDTTTMSVEEIATKILAKTRRI